MAAAHTSAFHTKHHSIQHDADVDGPDLHRAYHNQQRHDHHHQQSPGHRPRGLPVIPDLRFESSYVRSIQGFVSIERQGTTQLDAEEDHDEEGFERVDGIEAGRENKKAEVVRKEERITVRWNKVLWITVRDQVLSPLLQGALWALASYYIRPFSAEVGLKMGTFVRDGLPTIQKEGSAVSWLRDWAKSIGLSSPTSGGTGGTGNGQRTPL